MIGRNVELGSQSSLGAAIGWINDLLLGSLATGLCILAIASLGFLMLGGRMPIRDGMRVILGCFILLGAPIIASGIIANWEGAPPAPAPGAVEAQQQTRDELPPANFDPYAGASLRRD